MESQRIIIGKTQAIIKRQSVTKRKKEEAPTQRQPTLRVTSRFSNKQYAHLDQEGNEQIVDGDYAPARTSKLVNAQPASSLAVI